jgi:hypothetical protein
VLRRVNLDASVAGDRKQLSVRGYYDINEQALHSGADITSLNLDFLNHPFFAKYVRQVSGTASAKASRSTGPCQSTRGEGWTAPRYAAKVNGSIY